MSPGGAVQNTRFTLVEGNSPSGCPGRAVSHPPGTSCVTAPARWTPLRRRTRSRWSANSNRSTASGISAAYPSSVAPPRSPALRRQQHQEFLPWRREHRLRRGVPEGADDHGGLLDLLWRGGLDDIDDVVAPHERVARDPLDTRALRLDLVLYGPG